MLNKILLAVDGSDISRRAIHGALKLAKRTDSKIIALAVAVDCNSYLSNDFLISNDEKRPLSDILNDAESHVQEVGDLGLTNRVVVEQLVVMGDSAAEEILNAAIDQDCNLIFMGSHGRSGLDRMLFGSEAQKVLTDSKIPVLIFK